MEFCLPIAPRRRMIKTRHRRIFDKSLEGSTVKPGEGIKDKSNFVNVAGRNYGLAHQFWVVWSEGSGVGICGELSGISTQTATWIDAYAATDQFVNNILSRLSPRALR